MKVVVAYFKVLFQSRLEEIKDKLEIISRGSVLRLGFEILQKKPKFNQATDT